MAAREGLHTKPAHDDEWFTVPDASECDLTQQLLEQVQCLHREWAETRAPQAEQDVRLCVVEGLCKQLLEQQREQSHVLKQMHQMLEHLYHEHNRNEMRRRNYAIRSKNPIRFMPDSMTQTGSPPRTDLYDLLHLKQANQMPK